MHPSHLRVMRVGDDGYAQLELCLRKRGRICERRKIRRRIICRIETVGIDLAEISDCGLGARVGLAVGDPERRIIAAGIERFESRPFFLAADDAVELAIGKLVQLAAHGRIGCQVLRREGQLPGLAPG